MEIVIKVLQLILALSLLVFVHELGHYLTARIFGIRVEKFYLFFDVGGVSIFKFKIGETTFGLGWLPFGGYCKISGMIDESMDKEAMKQPPQSWEFRSKPAWQRLIVMVGGVVMNVITACLIYIGMSWYWGEKYIDVEDLRWGYAFNELGHELGFEDGDKLIGFGPKPVTGDAISAIYNMVIGQEESVWVSRGGNQMELTVSYDRTSEILDALKSGEFMMPRTPFVIGAVAPGMGAENAGMAVGDSLVAMNGVPMGFWDEWQQALGKEAGRTIDITVVRDSIDMRIAKVLNVVVSEDGKIGVNPFDLDRFLPTRTKHYNFPQAVVAGFRAAGSQISGYWDQLKLIVNPKTEAYKQVGSLISIGNIFSGQWLWHRFWAVTAFISIALAVINILPIPALDGGHVMFLLWEVITRRKPSDKVLEWAQVVGMILLLAILVLAFWNDIYRFFIK